MDHSTDHAQRADDRLVTLGDADVRMVAPIDLTVVQGEPRTVEMRLPPGYQLTGITGSSIDSSDQKAPSQNVINLQRRVAGVLPVRVEVPRAGTSYRFTRPLVVDDATSVSFHYKRKRK